MLAAAISWGIQVAPPFPGQGLRAAKVIFRVGAYSRGRTKTTAELFAKIEVTMTSHESNHSSTRFDTRQSARDQPHQDDGRDSRPRGDAGDLGIGASDRTVSITLGLGIGLMLVVILLPYLGGS